jgi:hypothetical protein
MQTDKIGLSVSLYTTKKSGQKVNIRAFWDIASCSLVEVD